MSANNRNFRSLLDFSLGRADALKTIAALGIDSHEDLFVLMARAHLPMPRLPVAITQGMTRTTRLPAPAFWCQTVV